MSPARIMIVEDELALARGIRRSLEALGYEVSSLVTSGEDAVRMALEEQPDLILMDVVLGDEMDGIDAAGAIRDWVKIPVVFITGYSQENILERAKRVEPFGYMIKPFTDFELRSTIEIAIYRSKMEDEREKRIRFLNDALEQVKQLNGLLPICANCKRIRDDLGYWSQVEEFISNHSEVRFTHSICPECAKRLYPELPGLK
ncbi:MAG: response regulator [Candidatus Latescibacterota bacterium]